MDFDQVTVNGVNSNQESECAIILNMKGLHKAMNIIYNRKERIVDNHV